MSERDVDGKQIECFVSALFKHADPDSYVSLRAFRDDIDGTWNPSAWRTIHLGVQGSHDPWKLIDSAVELAQLCAAADVPVVFAPPIVTFQTARGAAEKDVKNGLVLTVECDEHAEAARELLENLLGPTTVAVASGGVWTDPETGAEEDKLHLHWRLGKPTRVLAKHYRLKEARRFAQRLVGSDGSAVPLVHPLRWPGSWHRKATPRMARIVNYDALHSHLTEIDLDTAYERLKEAAEALPYLKIRSKRTATTSADINRQKSADPSGRPNHQPEDRAAQAAALDIAAALCVIPNDDLSYNEWIRIGLATWRASGGSTAGLAAWIAWSDQSKKFDKEATEARWKSFATSQPDQIGVGTLFFLAREAWPGWEKPSDMRRRRDNDPGDPPPHITGTSENIEPGPAGPEPEPTRRNGRDPEREPGSV